MAHPQLAYKRNRARQIAHGTWQPWANPAHVRDHVAKLLQTSTFQAVGEAAHVGQMTVWEIAHGARPVIKAETAQALLAVQPADLQPQRVDANGSVWRLRSLLAMGHTTGRITRALGASGRIIEPLIRGERATVASALRTDINRLFDAWWDKQPPRRTGHQKAAACKALQRAAVHNWPCPVALDDDELDLPGYKPAGRWRYAQGTGIAIEDPLGKRHQAAAENTKRQAGRPAETEREAVWDWISGRHAWAHNKGRDGLSPASISGGSKGRRIEPGKPAQQEPEAAG